MRGSILSGIFIGISGLAYLTLGGIQGAIFFSLGLMLVCALGVPLYTGRAGQTEDFRGLFVKILGGNIVGCFILSLLSLEFITDDIMNRLDTIIKVRENAGIIGVLVRSILCGVVMDCVVSAVKEGKNKLVIILGVTVFILSGFFHSIADSYYYFLGSLLGHINNLVGIVGTWILSVLGNFIGCNVRRLLTT